MSAKQKPVNTPLHLLQQLSGSLLEHLESACSQALADAEKLLAKLEKQRGKAQEKLHKSRRHCGRSPGRGRRRWSSRCGKYARNGGPWRSRMLSWERYGSGSRLWNWMQKGCCYHAWKVWRSVGRWPR